MSIDIICLASQVILLLPSWQCVWNAANTSRSESKLIAQDWYQVWCLFKEKQKRAVHASSREINITSLSIVTHFDTFLIHCCQICIFLSKHTNPPNPCHFHLPHCKVQDSFMNRCSVRLTESVLWLTCITLKCSYLLSIIHSVWTTHKHPCCLTRHTTQLISHLH